VETYRSLYLALRANRVPAPLTQNKALCLGVAITKVIAIAGSRH